MSAVAQPDTEQQDLTGGRFNINLLFDTSTVYQEEGVK
jgi:hypothetical protein